MALDGSKGIWSLKPAWSNFIFGSLYSTTCQGNNNGCKAIIIVVWWSDLGQGFYQRQQCEASEMN